MNAVNDAPVLALPPAQSAAEDTPLTFSSAGGNRISISDVDAGSGSLTVTVTASGGVFSLSGTTGLSFVAGDGIADSTMTFSGTLSRINTALNGLLFTPTLNYNGPASLQITVDDHTRAWRSLSNSAVSITIAESMIRR